MTADSNPACLTVNGHGPTDSIANEKVVVAFKTCHQKVNYLATF